MINGINLSTSSNAQMNALEKSNKAKVYNGLFGGCDSKKIMAKSRKGKLNLNPLKRAGASISPSENGYVVSFARNMTASTKNAQFVQSLLKKCQGKDCDLINISNDPLWDVEEIGINKFLIKPTGR